MSVPNDDDAMSFSRGKRKASFFPVMSKVMILMISLLHDEIWGIIFVEARTIVVPRQRIIRLPPPSLHGLEVRGGSGSTDRQSWEEGEDDNQNGSTNNPETMDSNEADLEVGDGGDGEEEQDKVEDGEDDFIGTNITSSGDAEKDAASAAELEEEEEAVAGSVKGNHSEEQDEETIDEPRDAATELRARGKELHDAGDFVSAANTFARAAQLLNDAFLNTPPRNASDLHQHDNDSDTDYEPQNDPISMPDVLTEYATCRLHEALCHLKSQDFVSCIMACTDILDDGISVVPLDDASKTTEHQETTNSSPKQKKQTKPKISKTPQEQHSTESTNNTSPKRVAVVRIAAATTTPTTTTSSSSTKQIKLDISTAARARAFHRRARARLALGDSSGALDDARSAAFFGDRKAVSFYGRLMREMAGGTAKSSSQISQWMGSSDPFAVSASQSTNPQSPPSFFGSGSDTTQSSLTDNPFGLLGDMKGLFGGEDSNNNSGGMDTIAKSLMSKMVRKIEEQETQERICQYLNSADSTSLRSMASMVGLSLNEDMAKRITKFANQVTPKGIQKSVKMTKRLLSVFRFLRKVSMIFTKYRHIVVLLVILGWTRSALQRPIPHARPIHKKAMERMAKKSGGGGGAAI